MSETPVVTEKRKKGRPCKPSTQKRNEKGELLRKDGKTVDRRPEVAKKNLKSKVFLDVEKAKQLRKEALQKAKEEIPSDSEDEEEEEDEFDIEPLIVKKRAEPQVVEVEKIIEKEVIKEVIKDDPVKNEKIKKLEEKHRMLSSSFREYQQTNNLLYRARSMDIKM